MCNHGVKPVGLSPHTWLSRGGSDMQRLWYRLRLGWEDFRHLPFVTRRTPIAWLGVVLATMVLLGGLAIALRTAAPSGQAQAPPVQYGAAPTTLPGTPSGGAPGAGLPGRQPGAGQPGAAQPGAGGGQPGLGGGSQGGQPVTTVPSADATAPGGVPSTVAPGGGGAVPSTTGPSGADTTTTTNPQNPGSTAHTLLPPISVSLTLPLPLLGDASAGLSAGAAQPAGAPTR